MRTWLNISKVGCLAVLGMMLWGANIAQANLYFDMGSSTSALQSGYTRIAENTIYSPSLGYGWNTAVGTASHGAPTGTYQNLLLDYDYGLPDTAGQRTFEVNLAAGVYDVKLYFYDQTHGKNNIQVYLGSSNTLLAQVDTLAPNTLITKEFDISMSSAGTLDLRFFRPDVDTLGGVYTDKWVISGIDISIAAIPIPSTLLLLGIGLVGLGLLGWRRRQAS